MSELHDKVRAVIAAHRGYACTDTIAELLAENERQAEELRKHAEYVPALTDRMMEAEAAFANERVATIELQQRVEAAEANCRRWRARSRRRASAPPNLRT